MCQKKEKEGKRTSPRTLDLPHSQSKKEKERKRAGTTGILSPYPKNTFTNKCDMVLSDKRSRASIVKVVKNPVEAI